MRKKKPTLSVRFSNVYPTDKTDFIIYDQVGDRNFPRCHAPFQLEEEAFRRTQFPELPSAKIKVETLQWAEDTCEGISKYERLKHDAKKAKRLEQKGGMTQEERDKAISKIRFGIDEFLLCRKRNPAAISDLTKMLNYGLTQLYSAVKEEKNKAAATELTTLLAKHVDMLHDLVLENPRIFKELAHKLPTFPISGSRFKDKQLENERFLNDVLEVGKDHWNLQIRKQRISKEAGPAKEIARKLIDYLCQYRMGYRLHEDEVMPKWTKQLPKLKRLSPENWKDWFKLAWGVVLETTNGRPCEVAAYLAIAKRSHKRNSYENPVAASNSGIRDALSDAFCELVTGKSPRTAQRKKRSERPPDI